MWYAKLKDGTPVVVTIMPTKSKIYLPAVDMQVLERGRQVTKRMAEVREIESLGHAVTIDNKRITVSSSDLTDIEEIEDEH